VIPTLTEGVGRKQSRSKAKHKLGLSPETMLLISVARRAKFRSANGLTYPDLILPALAANTNTKFIIVGGGENPDWRTAIEQSNGRIASVDETPDTSDYFEAADIYVDSYPFVSSTSMLEAANYKLPLVTLDTGSSETQIYGINHVGLVGAALVARSIPEFRGMLERVITDEGFRIATGETTYTAIRDVHQSPGWFRFINAGFERALELPPASFDLHRRAMAAVPQFSELDITHQERFASDMTAARFTKAYMGMLPFRERLSLWRDVWNANEFSSRMEGCSLFLPEWLRRNIKDNGWWPNA
jgi:hypothetical protein